MDAASFKIALYEERKSLPYLSPAALVASPKPWEGIPYRCEGLPLQTCAMIDIEAPYPVHSRAQNYQADLLRTSNQYAIGRAPTSGIYTGVEGTF